MASYGESGYIKLWRKEWQNPLFFDEPFTRWQAWVDLCMLADSSGTVKTSLRTLKNRWLWGSAHKVREYLGTLEGTGRITVKGTPNRGTLIVVKPIVEENNKNKKGTHKGTQKGTDKGIEELLLKEECIELSHNAQAHTQNNYNKNNSNYEGMSMAERYKLLMEEEDEEGFE